MLRNVYEVLYDLIDEEPCRWDHNHSCQSHFFFYIPQGELCPNEEAKRLLAEHKSEVVE